MHEDTVFAHFDPEQPATEANRNTAGHGKAPSSAYTGVLALQTILTLDQINLYHTVPNQAALRKKETRKKPGQRKEQL